MSGALAWRWPGPRLHAAARALQAPPFHGRSLARDFQRRGMGGARVTEHGPLTHLSADLAGVGSGALRDAALLTGLLIAAASAAGLNATAAPVVRTEADGGVSAFLLLDHCHLSVHSLPDR